MEDDMKHEDVKIGMKVVPLRKTAGLERVLINSLHWQEAKILSQPYLYVINYDDHCWLLSHREIHIGSQVAGDYYNASDFEPYEELEIKKPVLLGEESEKSKVRIFVIEKVYRRYDINFEYLPLEYRLKENDKEILDRSYLQDEGEFVGFFKALDYLGVKYEVLNRKINEGF